MMNILLPTDFSQNSRNAATYALKFFKDTPCHFHFLHVIPIATDALTASSMAMSATIQEKFDELLTQLRGSSQNSEHFFHSTFQTAYLIDAVRGQVQEKKIDLILMGTKGKTNRQGVIIGKNTSDVMTKVKCPVLAVSEHATFRAHKKILFPTDYKIPYGGEVLQSLLSLTALAKADVNILEIFNSAFEPSPEQQENRRWLQESFSPRIPVVQTYYSAVERNTNKIMIYNRDVDMIVLAAKNLKLCQKILQNEDTESIPFINQLPLLVLHG